MPIPVLSFHPGKDKRLALGSLWAFRNEIDFKEKDFAPGSLVAIQSAKGRPLGTGFVNSQSNLSFRLLANGHEARHASTEEGAIELIKSRLASAVATRQALLPLSEARRLVFSEGDGLSGLVVDQYGEVLVLQVNCLAFEQRKDMIIEELKKLTKCSAIVERSEGAVRQKEGLTDKVGLIYSEGSLTDAALRKHKISDGRLKFELNLLEGQKTGFFIDQRETRELVSSLSKDRDCLDMFCHTGALAMSMAKGGAKSVIAIDESAAALEVAVKQAKSNKCEITFEEGDAFKALRAMSEAGKRFDLIVLDPPAMSKGKGELGDALRGYKELNLRALKMLPPGGILVTCSCTGTVSEEEFLGTVQQAAVDATARLSELYRGGQPLDHPRNPAMPETRYLKVFAFRKL